mgnify:CR=1 FL=1
MITFLTKLTYAVYIMISAFNRRIKPYISQLVTQRTFFKFRLFFLRRFLYV